MFSLALFGRFGSIVRASKESEDCFIVGGLVFGDGVGM